MYNRSMSSVVEDLILADDPTLARVDPKRVKVPLVLDDVTVFLDDLEKIDRSLDKFSKSSGGQDLCP